MVSKMESKNLIENDGVFTFSGKNCMEYILLSQKVKQTENVCDGVFFQKVKNPINDRPTNKYMLSVPCMEYLIARKNRGEKISLRYAEISLRKGIVNSYTLMAWVVF